MKTKSRDNSRRTLSLAKPLFSILGILFLVVSLAIEPRAQDGDAGSQINVRVKDPQGAIVPRAEVTLYTRDNRVRIKTLTDNNGSWYF